MGIPRDSLGLILLTILYTKERQGRFVSREDIRRFARPHLKKLEGDACPSEQSILPALKTLSNNGFVETIQMKNGAAILRVTAGGKAGLEALRCKFRNSGKEAHREMLDVVDRLLLVEGRAVESFEQDLRDARHLLQTSALVCTTAGLWRWRGAPLK